MRGGNPEAALLVYQGQGAGSSAAAAAATVVAVAAVVAIAIASETGEGEERERERRGLLVSAGVDGECEDAGGLRRGGSNARLGYFLVFGIVRDRCR